MSFPNIPAGMGWPFVDATTGEFQSTAVKNWLGEKIESQTARVVNLGSLPGAAGDGTTDNTAIFQAAFDSVGEGEHVAFFLPVGTWLCGALKVKSHTVIQGVTAGTFGSNSFVGTRTSVLKLKAGTNAPLLTDNDAAWSYGVTLQDLAFDGNKANQTVAAPLIELKDAASGQDPVWRLNRVSIRNSKGDGLRVGTYRRAMKMSQSEVLDNDGNGIALDATDCSITDTFIGRNGMYGIAITASVQHIHACDIWHNLMAIHIAATGFATTITNCVIDSSEQHGIWSAAPYTVIAATFFHSNGQEANNTYDHINFGFPALTAQGSSVIGCSMRHDPAVTNKARYGIQTNIMVNMQGLSYNPDGVPWTTGLTGNGQLLALMMRSQGIRDGADFILGAGTGTRLGTAATQKLGFYGATPIVRPSGVAVTAAGIHAALVSLGLISA